MAGAADAESPYFRPSRYFESTRNLNERRVYIRDVTPNPRNELAVVLSFSIRSLVPWGRKIDEPFPSSPRPSRESFIEKD